MTRTAAVIVAAGRGVRAGGVEPKQWQSLSGKPVLAHTLAAFQSHPDIAQIVLVLHPDRHKSRRRISGCAHASGLRWR